MPTEMSAAEMLRLVFAGVFLLLSVASVVSLVLRSRLAPGECSPGIDNLMARIKAWWVMIGLLALAFWVGAVGIVLLFAFISFQCLREFVAVSALPAGDRKMVVTSFVLFLPLQYLLVGINWYGLFSILIPVYAFLLLPIVATLSGDTSRFLERVAKMQWGLMIAVYCLSHVPALMLLEIPGYAGRNALLIAFLVLIVQSSDVFQYIWGKLLGRRKVSPGVSPSKTLEGLIGGVLTSTALGGALWWITPFAPWQAALLALGINLMGFFGGLVLSAIKRDRGVKDWGNLIEGHGGMLDRVDSISFSAPIFFHLIRYWWVP